jgi:hypothetical protein
MKGQFTHEGIFKDSGTACVLSTNIQCTSYLVFAYKRSSYAGSPTVRVIVGEKVYTS